MLGGESSVGVASLSQIRFGINVYNVSSLLGMLIHGYQPLKSEYSRQGLLLVANYV